MKETELKELKKVVSETTLFYCPNCKKVSDAMQELYRELTTYEVSGDKHNDLEYLKKDVLESEVVNLMCYEFMAIYESYNAEDMMIYVNESGKITTQYLEEDKEDNTDLIKALKQYIDTVG